MQNEIVVNATPGETRVAIVENNTFVEFHLERASGRSVVGSVIKGRVTRVLPGMQAAFVDIGLEKAAFLYVGDYLPDKGSAEADDDEDNPRPRRRGRNGGRRQAPPKIETVLQEGQEVVVQVAKEPIGTKGARITSHISIAGRHLVLTPWSSRVGVSRRIDSDRERRRLRDVVERLKPDDVGFIIRTAGESVNESDLEADVKYLSETWREIQAKKKSGRAPQVLYREPDLPMRIIRDVAGGGTQRVVIDDAETHAEMRRFVEHFMVHAPRIERYEGAEPIFDHFGLEAQVDRNVGRKVWLKSGGYLIVDQSEALTAIDVNTGRYVGKRDLEETVLKTNLEAVREAVHQLRFRNIGGLIILDLIDMEDSGNREKVYRSLQEVLRDDKARTNVLKISELGLVEMTRKRTRESLVQTLCEPCDYCGGKGYVLSAESVAFKVLREIRKDLPRLRGRKVAVAVSRRVGGLLLGRDRPALEALEAELGREIEILVRPHLHLEQFEVRSEQPGEAVEFLPAWLAAGAEAAETTAADPADDEDDEEEEHEEQENGGAAEAEEALEAEPAADLPEAAAEAAPALVAQPALAATLDPEGLDSEGESRILPGSETALQEAVEKPEIKPEES